MGKNKRKSSSYRKQSRLPFENNVGNKKTKRHNFNYDQGVVTPNNDDTVYRILCPIRKIGSVIGKGGGIIKALREETHAKIKVGESVPGTDERVVIIFSSSTRKPTINNTNEDPEDPDDPEDPEDLQNDVPTENDEHEQMQPHCPAQDALLKVHDRIAEDDELYGGTGHEDNDEDDIVTARLLVPSNQVGCLLGKGGHVIQKLRSETGANIRVLPAEHLPACAMSTDELVQISGTSSITKKALYEVSTLLHQNPRPPMNYPTSIGGQGFHPPGLPMADMMPQENPMWSHRNSGFRGTPPMPWFGGYGSEFSRFGPGGFNGAPAGHAGKASAEFTMKILCPAQKIGIVIGKGGSNVRQIQQETGANIHVDDRTPEADERVIIVSAFEAPWNPRSPTIEAILQLQNSTNEISDKGSITTRLLVSSSKVGCILGQGGHIITEMRRRTQADIRVISKDGKPECASEDEELVQISGNFNVARGALSEIASRLRVRSLEGVNAAPEPGPVGPFRGFGPSENFSERGKPPSGMIGAGSSGGYEHVKGGGHKYEAPTYPMQATATRFPNINGSMEVKIPNSAVGSFLGAGGSNISNIGQMSGARVKLNDPQSSGSECVVEIHGSSEQMKAAQNLLQSFIASAVQNFNAHQQQSPYSSAVQNFNAHQQHNPYASAAHNFTQQQQSPYTAASAQNFTQQQQQDPYASAGQNFNTQQQHDPYASAVQNFNAQQQQQDLYASAAQNYNTQDTYSSAFNPAQQQQDPYSSAAQNFNAQQQQQDPYASTLNNQQGGTYTSAAQNFDTQQQQGSYQY